MNSTAALAVGDRFEMDTAMPYTLDGDKRTHSFTKVCEVTEADETGFSYVVLDVTNESDRPHFAGTPKGGSVAWFAVPRYLDRGTMRIGG